MHLLVQLLTYCGMVYALTSTVTKHTVAWYMHLLVQLLTYCGMVYALTSTVTNILWHGICTY